MKQKTFKYGLCKPTLNADLVNQEIDKGFIYQNKLIEIERWKRDQIRLVYGKFDNIPQLELNVSDKETIFNEIKKQIKKENAESRTKIKNKILSDKKNNAHIELMAAEKILKDARSQIDKLPEFKEAKKKINDEANFGASGGAAEKTPSPLAPMISKSYVSLALLKYVFKIKICNRSQTTL